VDLEALVLKESINKLGLIIELQGFLKGGTKAFNIYRQITFDLFQFYYYIKISFGEEKLLAEKLYHQKWNDQEIEHLAELIAEVIWMI